jgi:UDP-N-acetylmuramoylalanine--D-glutamate ligase
MRSRTLLFCAEPGRVPPEAGVALLGGRLVWCEGDRREPICGRDEIPLLGCHNTANAMAAAAAARALGVDAAATRAGLASFHGLEHRLEFVGTSGQVRFYNDSYSTTPESVVAAVQSFTRPIVLIAGGYDKELDLTPLVEAAVERAEVLIALGQTGAGIAAAARGLSARLGRGPLVREVGGLAEAVAAAGELARPGAVVVFSPGCASYDMFENFDQRGQAFREEVRTRLGGGRGRRRTA